MGSPEPPTLGDPRLPERFWSKVVVVDDCWEWVGYRQPKGYGRATTVGRKLALTHRIAYEALVGPVPPTLQLDHLCRNKPCCNPAHLEIVTNDENRQRRKAAQTHCKWGHLFDADNTCVYPSKPTTRLCRICLAEYRERTVARRAAREQTSAAA